MMPRRSTLGVDAFLRARPCLDPTMASVHFQTLPRWSKVPLGLANPVHVPTSVMVLTMPLQLAMLVVRPVATQIVDKGIFA